MEEHRTGCSFPSFHYEDCCSTEVWASKKGAADELVGDVAVVAAVANGGRETMIPEQVGMQVVHTMVVHKSSEAEEADYNGNGLVEEVSMPIGTTMSTFQHAWEALALAVEAEVIHMT